MKNALPIFLVFFISLGVSRMVIAQDQTSFRQKAEEIVKIKNSGWKLIKRQERDKQVTYLWGAGEMTEMRLTIFYGASQREATERMRVAFKMLSMGPGKKRTDIGDEAYSWEAEGGGAGIRFRKANVYIDIAGPSKIIVEDLAKSLAKIGENQ